MLFRGTVSNVEIWYVCWGGLLGHYGAELYMTSHGLRDWIENTNLQSLPVRRIGRMVITEAGPQEVEHWDSREDFLNARG